MSLRIELNGLNKLDGIVMLEKIDLKILDALIDSDLLKTTFNNPFSQKIYCTEKDQLIKYRKLVKNGFAYVVYEKVKSMGGFGRSNPLKALGLFSIRREIRQTLAKPYYIDIDICNCHPVILLQICKKNKIQCKYLEAYVKNRDELLKKVMDDYNVTRDDAKKLFIRLLYFGSFENWRIELNIPDTHKESSGLAKFREELRSIGQIIALNNPHLVDLVEKSKEIKKQINYNKVGSVVSFYLQQYEFMILEHIYNYCVYNKIIENNEAVLCADGLMIYKEKYNDNLLTEFNKLIKEKLGFDLTFTTKEMTQDYLDQVHKIIDNKKKEEELKKTQKEEEKKQKEELKQKQKEEEKKQKEELKKTQKEKEEEEKEKKRKALEEEKEKKRKALEDEKEKKRKALEDEKEKKKSEAERIKQQNRCDEEKEREKNITKREEENHKRYLEIKKQIEDEYFYLKEQGLFGMYDKKDRKLSLLSRQTVEMNLKPCKMEIFNNKYGFMEGNFYNKWIEDPERREYKNITFDPDNIDIKEYFNLFTGFKLQDITEYKREDTKPLHRFLDHVLGNMKKYVLEWFAFILKNKRKTDVAIVLYSDSHGVGKNSVVELLIRLMDSKYVSKVEKIDDFSNNFNSLMEGRFLVYGDEIMAKNKELYTCLKNIITRTEITITKKGVDPYICKDRINYFFTTNDPMPFKVEERDRRISFIPCSEKPMQKKEYDEWYKNLKNENLIKSFFDELMKMEIPDKIVCLDNDFKKDIQRVFIPSPIKYLFKYHNILENQKYTVNKLFEEIKQFEKENGYTETKTTQYMALKLKQIGEFAYKSNDKRGYHFVGLADKLKAYNADLFAEY
jgi:hypothetical protein